MLFSSISSVSIHTSNIDNERLTVTRAHGCLEWSIKLHLEKWQKSTYLSVCVCVYMKGHALKRDSANFISNYVIGNIRFTK